MTNRTTPQAADLVAGTWLPIPGSEIVSICPANPAQVLWRGTPVLDHVDAAVEAANAAQLVWAAWPCEKRFAVLRDYAARCKARVDEIGLCIANETGKALWDSKAEAGILAGKVAITLEQSEHSGMSRVSDYEVPLTESRTGRTWFRPHGVMAVIAPFNFPAHLANGHIVPALAMGNTIVLKPSDKTPAVGQLLISIFQEALEAADAPAGVVNLVQGGAQTAKKLTTHADIDGILFTGSWSVGRRILQANLDNPGRIIALEMGGNNPAVIMPDCNFAQAAIECARAAFITTGQRCTCTRRIIVHRDIADRFIKALCKIGTHLRIGDPFDTDPVFMGPIISDEARQAVFDAQSRFASQGGEVLLESTPIESEKGAFLLGPSVVRVDRFHKNSTDDAGCDCEVFGPLVRVSVTDSLDDAIEQANATQFGLAASIFTTNQDDAEQFLLRARAGCVNVNAGTAGASSKLPFGGLGKSGNHRPAGAFSLDYCAFPSAGMLEDGTDATVPTGMTVEDAWLDS